MGVRPLIQLIFVKIYWLKVWYPEDEGYLYIVLMLKFRQNVYLKRALLHASDMPAITLSGGHEPLQTTND